MSSFFLNSTNYKTYFSWNEFSKLNKQEREELIRYSVEQIRNDKGLKKVDVNFFEADQSLRGSCGRIYDGKHLVGHVLKLNANVLTEAWDYYTPYKLFNTINHELEHALQFEQSANHRIKNSNPAVFEQRLNDQHYYCAGGDKSIIMQGEEMRVPRFSEKIDEQLYLAQASEAEARAAGFSAVKDLFANNRNDPYLEKYLLQQGKLNIANNKEMMETIGMHPREEMAREELKYISTRRINEVNRRQVIEYARQKDFQIAREVLNALLKDKASEDELNHIFNSDIGYENFFKTKQYVQNKVTETNHDFYIYAKYKWDESVENSGQSHSNIDSNMQNQNVSNALFFEEIEKRASEHVLDGDYSFFEQNKANQETNSEADIAFFESTQHGSSEEDKTINDKYNNVMPMVDMTKIGHKR